MKWGNSKYLQEWFRKYIEKEEKRDERRGKSKK